MAITISIVLQGFTHEFRDTHAFAFYERVETSAFFFADPHGDYITPQISTCFSHWCESPIALIPSYLL
jgi:hypothetical protein